MTTSRERDVGPPEEAPLAEAVVSAPPEDTPKVLDDEDDYFADGDSSLFRRFPACIFFIPLWLVTTIVGQVFYRNPAPSKFGEHETTERTLK